MRVEAWFAIAAARSSRLGHHPDSFIYASEERFVPPQSVAVAYSDANNISLPIYGQVQLPGNQPGGTYSDVLQVQLATGVPLVHVDLAEQTATIARATTPESTLRRIDAVLACREAVDANVAPLLAVEAMALYLRTG